MNRIAIIIGFIISANIAFAQEEVFKSVSSIKQIIENEIVNVERDVIINDKQIVITKFLNAGKGDLILNIERVEKKEYSYDGKCKWYYCKLTIEDVFNGFMKYIIIIPSYNPRSIYVYGFVEEVRVQYTKILVQ